MVPEKWRFGMMRNEPKHVTPPGLCRIRHYGFLSNRCKEQQLPRCRELLGQTPPANADKASGLLLLLRLTGIDVTRCPQCQDGTMVVVERIPASSPARVDRVGVGGADSS